MADFPILAGDLQSEAARRTAQKECLGQSYPTANPQAQKTSRKVNGFIKISDVSWYQMLVQFCSNNTMNFILMFVFDFC